MAKNVSKLSIFWFKKKNKMRTNFDPLFLSNVSLIKPNNHLMGLSR